MPKYIVTIKEVHTQNVLVEAESEEDAIAKVADGEGEYNPSGFDYFETMPQHEWKVALQEE